jgi:hypothetical protein
MRISAVPFVALKKLLQEFGFKPGRHPQGYFVFLHPNTDHMIILPSSYEHEVFLYHMHLFTIQHELEFLDLMAKEDFDRFVAKYQRKHTLQQYSVSFSEFSKLLSELNFDLSEHSDHYLFSHTQAQAWISLPKYQPQDMLEALHLSITEHILDMHDLIRPVEFIKLIQHT